MPRFARSLDLPPPFRPLALREAGDAYAHATSRAAALGAGTLVFVGRFDVAEFAVVFEPEEPLPEARRAFYAGMVALVDTLAALAPPETPIAIAWPDAVQIDGGLVGGGRLAWPAGAREDSPPEWLVFGAAIRLVSQYREQERLSPLSTALADEGFGAIGVECLVEGFARHLLIAFDRWHEGDFATLARDYLARLPPARGWRPVIEANGDLRLTQPGRPVARRDLRAALATPSWLDPATGAPRR
jgi:hypothetical protein